MKCSELRLFFERLSALCSFGGGRAPAELPALQQLLDLDANGTVAQLSKSISKVKVEYVGAAGGISVLDLRSVLDVCGQLIATAGKPAFVKDLDLLKSSLGEHASVGVDELVIALSAKPQPKPKKSVPVVASIEVVQKHYRALESTLGDDDGFHAALRALEADPAAQTAELIALAKQFSFAAVKTRPAAIKKILARHLSLMTSRAKKAATAGRIAG